MPDFAASCDPFATELMLGAHSCAKNRGIEGGYHREAMFWIGVTHSRCQKVLSLDAPRHLTQRYKDSYQELVSDIGVPTVAKIRQRCTDIQRILPRLRDLAAGVIAANDEIEDD
jgi:hypothetical protein